MIKIVTFLVILVASSISTARTLQRTDFNENPTNVVVEIPEASNTQYVDLRATDFRPGRNNPTEWMSTASIIYEGYSNTYAVEQTNQDYNITVAGIIDPQFGILAYEYVGVIAVTIPDSLMAVEIVSVELFFVVGSSNLFPDELIAITPLTTGIHPSTQMAMSEMGDLYFDAGGWDGVKYTAGHYANGTVQLLDLGLTAVADFERAKESGWFGVGLTAENWNPDALIGQWGQWVIFGGGTIPALNNQPRIRVYYKTPVSATVSSFGAIKAMYSDN